MRQFIDRVEAPDEPPVGAIGSVTTDERIRFPASKWLKAYRLARWLGFTEVVARKQAGNAWDRAVDELAFAAAIAPLELN